MDQFRYLKQGIATVLIFIGAKMLISFFKIDLQIWVSLLVIVICIIKVNINFVVVKLKEENNVNVNVISYL